MTKRTFSETNLRYLVFSYKSVLQMARSVNARHLLSHDGEGWRIQRLDDNDMTAYKGIIVSPDSSINGPMRENCTVVNGGWYNGILDALVMHYAMRIYEELEKNIE